MLNLIQWLKKFLSKIQCDSIGAFAAQSAYFTILSFFPFVMLLMTVLKFLPIEEETLITSIVDLVPQSSATIVMSLMQEILRKSSGTLMSVTIILLLWTAGKGILSITNGLNAVNEVRETRNYFILRFVATIYTLLFAIMIILTLVIIVFGDRLYELIMSYFPRLSSVAAFVISIRTVTALLVLTLFFMFFYRVLPARKLRLRYQLPGAILAAVGWLLGSYGFSIYVDYSTNLSYMYGSLTGIILLMLWLYLCMYILFIGAEFNFMLYSRKNAGNYFQR